MEQHFFAEKLGCKIEKKSGHVGRHRITLIKSNYLKNFPKITLLTLITTMQSHP